MAKKLFADFCCHFVVMAFWMAYHLSIPSWFDVQVCAEGRPVEPERDPAVPGPRCWPCPNQTTTGTLPRGGNLKKENKIVRKQEKTLSITKVRKKEWKHALDQDSDQEKKLVKKKVAMFPFLNLKKIFPIGEEFQQQSKFYNRVSIGFRQYPNSQRFSSASLKSLTINIYWSMDVLGRAGIICWWP